MTTHVHLEPGAFASRRGWKALRLIGLTLAGIGLAVLFALLFGLVVKVLWNWLMPAIFGLGKISFWQAFGLVLLGKLLFGGFAHAHRDHKGPFGHKIEERFKKFSRAEKPGEETPPTPGNGGTWRHFQRYWQEEGRAAFESYIKRMEDRESPPPESR